MCLRSIWAAEVVFFLSVHSPAYLYSLTDLCQNICGTIHLLCGVFCGLRLFHDVDAQIHRQDISTSEVLHCFPAAFCILMWWQTQSSYYSDVTLPHVTCKWHIFSLMFALR